MSPQHSNGVRRRGWRPSGQVVGAAAIGTPAGTFAVYLFEEFLLGKAMPSLAAGAMAALIAALCGLLIPEKKR